MKYKQFGGIAQFTSNYCRQILVIALMIENATKESFYDNYTYRLINWRLLKRFAS